MRLTLGRPQFDRRLVDWVKCSGSCQLSGTCPEGMPRPSKVVASAADEGFPARQSWSLEPAESQRWMQVVLLIKAGDEKADESPSVRAVQIRVRLACLLLA